MKPKDYATRADRAIIRLTEEQMQEVQPVLNNCHYENKGMVLAQVIYGEARVRWISPLKARIIVTVARLLGVGRVYK